MDRTNPHLAFLVLLIILVGGFGLTFYLYGKAQITMTFTSPHGNVDIYLDGQKVGTTPINLKKVPFGFRRFTFKKEGFQSREWIYDSKPRINYTGEIFLSDNSVVTDVLNTKASQFAAPSVYHNDMYITFGLNGEIETFDKNFKTVWLKELDETVLYPGLIYQDLIILGTFEGSIYVISKTKGTIRWKQTLETNAIPLEVRNDSLWVLTGGENLYHYTLDGQILEKESFNERIVKESFCFLHNSPTFLTEKGTLFSKVGDKWESKKYMTRGIVERGIVTENRVYILTSMGCLYAYDWQGLEVFSLENRFNLPYQMVLQEKLLVSAEKKFFIINPDDGKVLFERKLNEEINGFFFYHDKMIIGGKNRFLFFFSLNGEFITSKDLKSEVCGVANIPQISSVLVTTKENIYLIKIPDL